MKPAQAAIGVVLFLVLLIGFGISTEKTLPGYAPVYLDDLNKVYLAVPCLEGWQRRESKHVDAVRLGTAEEATRLKYNPDDICRNEGWFVGEDKSLIRYWLEEHGILTARQEWWDKPFRTEDGKVVYPGKGT
jgi:hypothetical protein